MNKMQCLFCLWLILSVLFGGCNQQDKPFLKENTQIEDNSLVLNSEYVGHIRSLLSVADKLSVVHLKVNGVVGSDDIRYIADQMLCLEILDLSGVEIYDGAIPERCFCKGDLTYGNVTLREIYLPSCSVRKNAFSGCVNLRKIIANSSSISAEAFSNISNLEYVEIGYGVDGCFQNSTINKAKLKPQFGTTTFHPFEKKGTGTVTGKIDSLIVTSSVCSYDASLYVDISMGYSGSCGYLSFEDFPDKEIRALTLSGRFGEVILPSGLNEVRDPNGYEFAYGLISFKRIVIKSNCKMRDLSSLIISSFPNEVYWYPNELPSNVKQNMSSEKKWYVRKSLINQFQNIWTETDGHHGPTFLSLEDSEYYKSHPEYR